MFGSIGRSIELARASLRVLRADKELILFPFVSFIALVIVTASFAVPFALAGGLTEAAEGRFSITTIVLAFAFYVVNYTVIFFFNTALVGAAMIRLDGGDPTLGDGLRIALSRLPAIIGYALIAATVGMILRWISERAGLLGQVVSGVIGFAWNVATFLVVPVLVVERVGPIEAIKRSGGLLRRTWGEQIVGNIGIGLVFGLLAFLFILLTVVAVVALAQVSIPLAIVALVVGILVVGAIALVGAAVSGIFTASVYRYATKGDGGPMYRPETLASAFRAKS